MANLRVAAVVTAQDRRQFLPMAVRSAVEAGADEVFVVRNFPGPIEGCEGQYVDIPCDVPETNEKEAQGLERADSEIVAFLDDDDLWEPTKVRRLRTEFGERPDLVYLCHAQRTIDAAGAAVTASHAEYAQKAPERFGAWDGRHFGELVGRIWPGNNSSTCLRRSWARSWLPTFRAAGWGADLFWLSAAYLDRQPMAMVPEPLTALRLHDQNMSHQRDAGPAAFRSRHRTSCERFARSLEVLTRAAVDRRGPNDPGAVWLRAKSLSFRLLADVEAGPGARRSAWRFLTDGSASADRGATMAALLALGSPAVARRALYRSALRRWRVDL